MRLAQAAQADLYAPDLYRRAEASQDKLDAEQKPWQKQAVLLARQTVQLAEDARLVALNNRQELERAQARKAAEEAQARAEEARAQAEADRQLAEAARDRSAREALQGREQVAEEASASARKQERQELRRRLSTLQKALLQTQETDHGLVVRLPHPLFAAGQAQLLPSARERLAKVAGILLAYPGLTIQVEGHTDSTGSEALNQDLSERRAEHVRDYLHRQGIPPQATRSVGKGASEPLASNASPGGRQRNRRVELVISGEPIGI